MLSALPPASGGSALRGSFLYTGKDISPEGGEEPVLQLTVLVNKALCDTEAIVTCLRGIGY